MMGRGLDDLVVIVINQRLEEDVANVGLIEDYTLPILQDSEESDVYGLWDAVAYDLFIVAREGHVPWTITQVHPAESRSYDGLVGVLSEFL